MFLEVCIFQIALGLFFDKNFLVNGQSITFMRTRNLTCFENREAREFSCKTFLLPSERNSLQFYFSGKENLNLQ